VTGLMRRVTRVDRRVWDTVMAAAFAIVGEIELLTRLHPGVAGAIGVGFAYSMLAFRRRRPLPAGAAMYATWVTLSLVAVHIQALNVPLVVALITSYSMGRYTEGRSVPLSFAVAVGGMLAVVSTMDHQSGSDFLFPTCFSLIAWVMGRSVRTRSQLTEELHEAAVRAEEAHDDELARVAAEERRRIARELHDVVAHSVSVMVVQAGGARRILDRDPARAIEAAANIEQAGRAALVEMRRLLGVLHAGEERSGEEGRTERAPAPGMRELGALVERSRAAGLPVELTVAGDPRSLPAGLDLAAYRILQEGLTNAIKYAKAAPTEVHVHWTPDALELTVADRGPGFGLSTGGHGLVGMRERVRLYGGELWTGRRDGGGFQIRARIPLVADTEMELV
jgi:signal transduction histidine kinase